MYVSIFQNTQHIVTLVLYILLFYLFGYCVYYKIAKRLTIGNMCRPPHANNNNNNIESFINETSQIIDTHKKENNLAAILGDFNIAARSHSLLDQIFCKVPCKEKADISASILLSRISDHFPYVFNFKILNKKPVSPKYVYQKRVMKSSLDQYRTDLRSLNIHTHLKADLMTDPNESYQIFENLIQTSYQRYFPNKSSQWLPNTPFASISECLVS